METNKIYLYDCLEGMKKIKDNSIDLIYLDPPFFTQQNQKLTSKEGIEYSFSDKWENITEYIEYLKSRLNEMKRILKNTGNIFVHCDKIANHRIRIILEEIFGVENFRSEIIWTYKRWSNSKKGLLDSHQNIYHFTKTNNFKFNIIYKNYSYTTNIDQILQDREKGENGKSKYKINDKGEIVYSTEKKGVPLGDVWEIPFLNPKAKERTGYPTQKPIHLLERIIEISTDENDFVLDPFLGSGTTVVAAKIMNRKFIGFDINEDAIKIAEKRLENPIKTESQLLAKGIKDYDEKNEREKMILSNFDCNIVQRNKGLDAILKKKINDKLIGIKIQKENETMLECESNLIKSMKNKNFAYGIIVKTKDDLFECKISDNIIVIEDIEYQLKKFLK